MPADRPDIPTALRRAVLVEAGHRCAIPTCQATTTEIAHIVPWATVKEHTFDNLIALCPNCHTRFDKSEIDRQSMSQYKTNLGLLHSRYGDLERRVLERLGSEPEGNWVPIAGGMDLLLKYLIQDGLLVEVLPESGGTINVDGIPLLKAFRLTPKGHDFVTRWKNAQEL